MARSLDPSANIVVDVGGDDEDRATGPKLVLVSTALPVNDQQSSTIDDEGSDAGSDENSNHVGSYADATNYAFGFEGNEDGESSQDEGTQTMEVGESNGSLDAEKNGGMEKEDEGVKVVQSVPALDEPSAASDDPDIPPLTSHEVATGIQQHVSVPDAEIASGPENFTDDSSENKSMQKAFDLVVGYLKDPASLQRIMTLLRSDIISHLVSLRLDITDYEGFTELNKLLHSRELGPFLKILGCALLTMDSDSGLLPATSNEHGQGLYSENNTPEDSQQKIGNPSIDSQNENLIDHPGVQLVTVPGHDDDTQTPTTSNDMISTIIQPSFGSTPGNIPEVMNNAIVFAMPSSSAGLASRSFPEEPKDSIIYDRLETVLPQVFSTAISMRSKGEKSDAIWRACGRKVFKGAYEAEEIMACSLSARKIDNTDSATAFDEMKIQTCAKCVAFACREPPIENPTIGKFRDYNNATKITDIPEIHDCFRKAIMTSYKCSVKRKLMNNSTKKNNKKVKHA